MRFGAPAVVRLKSSLHCDAPKVDIVPLFEKRETNNRNLLCQGIDTLAALKNQAAKIRWPGWLPEKRWQAGTLALRDQSKRSNDVL
jgi:hypothetical protein